MQWHKIQSPESTPDLALISVINLTSTLYVCLSSDRSHSKAELDIKSQLSESPVHSAVPEWTAGERQRLFVVSNDPS